jgi:hypothetical protein
MLDTFRDVLVEICALDVGHNSRVQIQQFQEGQADAKVSYNPKLWDGTLKKEEAA